MLKLKSGFPNKLRIVLLAAFVFRIAFSFYYPGIENDNYWEYGELSRNLVNGNGYSLFYFEGNELKHNYTPSSKPHPSAYMPPAYPVVICPFMLIDNHVLRNILYNIFNALLSVLFIILLYRFTLKHFSDRAAFFAAIMYCILPEFIYSAVSPGPTVIYHILSILIVSLLYDIQSGRSYKKALQIALLSALLIYFRSEFALFLIIIIISLLIKRLNKETAIIFGTVIILLLPWQIRNYNVFGEAILFTTSSGLNLYRGHNPYRPGVWGDEGTAVARARYQASPEYELLMNRYFEKEAIHTILNDTGNEAIKTVKKVFHLWIYFPYDNRSVSPVYLIPWIIILVLSFYGMSNSGQIKRNKYLYLFLLYHTLIAMIFFALPRYQTMMKIALLPFAGIAIAHLIDIIKKKTGN